MTFRKRIRHLFMDKIIDQLINYAQLNFTQKLDLKKYEDQDEKLTSIAVGVSILGEELEDKVLKLKAVNTELNKKSHFIENVTNAIPESVFVYDLVAKKITYKNKCTQDDFRLPCLFILRKCEHRCHDCKSNQALKMEEGPVVKGVDMEEIQVFSDHHQEKWYKVSVSPFEKNKIGIATTELITLTDITDSKKKELELLSKEKKISESLEEKQLLLQEVHHRVKNNLQIISGLIELKVNRLTSKEAVLQLKEIKNRVKSIALIHDTLYQANDFSKIDMSQYSTTLIRSLSDLFYLKEKNITLTLNIDSDILFPIDKAIPLGLLISEAVSNCYKHAFNEKESGVICVTFAKGKNGHVSLEIKDNGKGYTHINDKEPSDTLGVKLIKSFGRQLDTEVKMFNEDGLTMLVNIPMSKKKNKV